MKYICQNKDFLNNLMKHTNRKAICDVILKILSSKYFDFEEISYFRIEFLEKIFNSFNPDDDESVINVCDLLNDIFLNNKFYLLIIKNKEIFEKLHILLLKNINNSHAFKELLRVFIKLYELILYSVKQISNESLITNTLNMYMSYVSSNSLYDKDIQNEALKINNHLYIFEITLNTLNVIKKDFITSYPNNYHSTFNKITNSLGLKKYLFF